MAIFKDPSPARTRSPYAGSPDRPMGETAATGHTLCAPGDIACLKTRAGRMPTDPGVYLWKDEADTTLYVGKATNLRARVRSYLSGPQEAKTEAMVQEACDVEFIATHTEKEALILEQTLIKREKPRYNIRLTDDKKYPYIMATRERYPRIVYTRDPGAKGTLFGPFPDAGAAKYITRLLNESFKLRQCRTLPTRACIYHQMGQCLAPCIQAVPDEEYKEAATDARAFLKGRGLEMLGELRRRMKDAADKQRFEEAARLRDTIAAIDSVLERQRVFARGQEDRDVVGVAREGDRACVVVMFVRDGRVVGRESYFLSHAEDAPEAALVSTFLAQYYGTALAVPGELVLPVDPTDGRLLADWLRERRQGAVRFTVPQRGDKLRVLEMAGKNAELLMKEDHFKREREKKGGVDELQALLRLEAAPVTIDGFDISHHGGTQTVASMVRFHNGLPHKDMYRRYKIQTASGGDDYAAMREAVHRRFRGLIERGDEMPDLVLIDGGRGQLNAALAALEDLGIDWQPIVSLAKREEEIYTPLNLHPIKASRHHEGRKLLERVRDEAHRFAIRYQDTLKRKTITDSPLLAVPGVGPKRVRLLLARFGSVRAIAATDEDTLATLPGIDRKTARAIVEAARRAQSTSSR